MKTMFNILSIILIVALIAYCNKYVKNSDKARNIFISEFTIFDSVNVIKPVNLFLNNIGMNSYKKIILRKNIFDHDTSLMIFLYDISHQDSIAILLDENNKIYGLITKESKLAQNCQRNQTSIDTLTNFCRSLPCLIPFYEYESNYYCNGIKMLRFLTMPKTETNQYPKQNKNGSIEIIEDPYVNFLFQNDKLVGIYCGG